MARQILFLSHDDSSVKRMPYGRLSKVCTPFRVRLNGNKDKLGTPVSSNWNQSAWFELCDEKHPFVKSSAKPLFAWILDFIATVENIPFEEAKELSWQFSYYVHIQHGDEESEFVFKCSAVVWFVTIYDTDGNIVHRNWTISLDEEGDIKIKRTNDQSNTELTFWKHSEERIAQAVYDHLRLRSYHHKK